MDHQEREREKYARVQPLQWIQQFTIETISTMRTTPSWAPTVAAKSHAPPIGDRDTSAERASQQLENRAAEKSHSHPHHRALRDKNTHRRLHQDRRLGVSASSSGA